MGDSYCHSKKSRSNRTIPIRLLKDHQGYYLPFCLQNYHPGIVHNGQHRKCEKINCRHYIRFRPATSLKRPDIKRILRSLEDL